MIDQLTQSRDNNFGVVEFETQLTEDPCTNCDELTVARIQKNHQVIHIAAPPEFICNLVQAVAVVLNASDYFKNLFVNHRYRS